VDLFIRTRDSQGLRVVSAQGTLDSSTSAKLEVAIQEALKAGAKWIVFDLEEAEYVSSAGWGSILAHSKEFKNAGGGVVVSGIPMHLRMAWKALGVEGLVASVAELDDAFRHVRAATGKG